MTRERFSQLVEAALGEIPERFRDAMQNVVLVVEDAPSRALLRDLGMSDGQTLLGLYHGTPLPQRSWDYGNVLPDRISIYQAPIEEACGGDEGEIRHCIAETVIHEFGHYFGLSEDEIQEIERKFWRGDSIQDE